MENGKIYATIHAYDHNGQSSMNTNLVIDVEKGKVKEQVATAVKNFEETVHYYRYSIEIAPDCLDDYDILEDLIDDYDISIIKKF